MKSRVVIYPTRLYRPAPLFVPTPGEKLQVRRGYGATTELLLSAASRKAVALGVYQSSAHLQAPPAAEKNTGAAVTQTVRERELFVLHVDFGADACS